MKGIIEVEEIGRRIYVIRGHRVMLDADLAAFYGVRTKELNKAATRNPKRFPPDFMFVLTPSEAESLRFQSGTLKRGRGQHGKYLPHVFTEQGVAMLSSVLRSERAVLVNVVIMRAFVKFREVLAGHHALAKQLKVIERQLADHHKDLGQHTDDIRTLFESIRRLMEPVEADETKPLLKLRVTGFRPGLE